VFAGYANIWPDGRKDPDRYTRRIGRQTVRSFDFAAVLATWLELEECPIWTSASAFRRQAVIDAGLFPAGRCVRGGDVGKMVGRPGIVGVEEGNPVGLRPQDGHVARGVAAGPWLRPAQDRQALAVMAHDLVQAAVGRGIVHDEDLGRRLGLGEHGLERTCDVRAFIVKRNDDCEAGHATII
jgi:hypothetical protein